MTTPRDSKIIVVGKLGAPYGVKGWLKVYSLTDPPENLFHYHPWQFYIDHQWVTLPIQEIRPNTHPPVIQLEGCSSPEEAKRYTGVQIGIETSQLPELPWGEYYWTQLIGLEVITAAGTLLGMVDHLIETGANDILVVTGKKKHLIPYLPNQVVLSVDLAKKQIIVDWDPEF